MGEKLEKKNPSISQADEMAKLFVPSSFLFLFLAVVAGPYFSLFILKISFHLLFCSPFFVLQFFFQLQKKKKRLILFFFFLLEYLCIAKKNLINILIFYFNSAVSDFQVEISSNTDFLGLDLVFLFETSISR